MFENLPYIHYMTKVGQGRNATLLSPAEADEASPQGGCFFIPVQDTGKIFPAYWFDFNYYLGQGERSSVWTGMTLPVVDRGQEYLLFTFGFPSPMLSAASKTISHLLTFPKKNGKQPTLVFRRVPSKGTPSTYPYAGKLKHRDFSKKFAEIETLKTWILEELLDHYGISLIGCDPFSHYRGLAIAMAKR